MDFRSRHREYAGEKFETRLVLVSRRNEGTSYGLTLIENSEIKIPPPAISVSRRDEIITKINTGSCVEVANKPVYTMLRGGCAVCRNYGELAGHPKLSYR
ncbi:hypothetical protein KM043_012928 [Ampulex compressa]|nr:hypothetical protein KM043_012928 [Ampulex compressa]